LKPIRKGKVYKPEEMEELLDYDETAASTRGWRHPSG